jgi:hypothetical protein
MLRLEVRRVNAQENVGTDVRRLQSHIEYSIWKRTFFVCVEHYGYNAYFHAVAYLRLGREDEVSSIQRNPAVPAAVEFEPADVDNRTARLLDIAETRAEKRAARGQQQSPIDFCFGGITSCHEGVSKVR